MTDERFEAGAPAYAAYLETTEGRLRLDLAWQRFRPFLDELADGRAGTGDGAGTRRGFDLGGGTGALGLRLAARGWRVAIVDASAAMLALAERNARGQGLSHLCTFHRTDAARAAELFDAHSFDAALCHNVLEYVHDPQAAVLTTARLLRPGGYASLLVRNRAGEAMRDALKRHDLDAAERALAAASVNESLYGGPAKVFDPATLRGLAAEAGLRPLALFGVRVVADYLPPSLSETEEAYARLLTFELRLGARHDFAAVARYLQLVARA